MQDDIVFLDKCRRGMIAMQSVAAIEYAYNPRELVHEYKQTKLYHYRPITKKINATPILVVFATVNRPEILDLMPQDSFIRGLLESGTDVYLLDWGYPALSDKETQFNDYINEYLHECVQFIMAKRKIKKINLLGICQGGTICLCYVALYKTIKKLVLISAPIDFHTPDNVVGALLNKIDFSSLTAVTGNVPGAWLTQFFISLRPFELLGKKYLRFLDKLDDKQATEKFLRVEKWLYDAPDQPGAAFTQFVTNFYQKNKLIENRITINDKNVKLKDLSLPILNIMASEDEIVPMSATAVLKKHIQKKYYDELVYPCGHIGIYISEKAGKQMGHDISKWLAK